MRPERSWRLPLAALLMFALAIGWPFAGTGWQTPAAHAYQTANSDHHAGATHSPFGAHDRATHEADCGASAIGCCMMTLCHPAISIEPFAMPVMAVDAATGSGRPARGPGSNPRVDVPPPRFLPV